ncbi:MFS transporter [Demequina activiva]|uniref:MFS transporter n=1 Tax=Demequina activiva TaxID=1582364 RepID=A0A919Q127_9MICO|nr:MFS transporter [Demequina activiva]GIG53327.1 MFS transporter [Demequina activiva]
MPSKRIFSFLVDDDDADVQSLKPDARPHIAANGVRQMVAQALQSMGDQVVNAKTVLPWLVTALGAPGAFVAFLVPIRESGSMLPQAAWAPKVRQRPRRKWVWVAGATGQAVATAAMALVATTASGVVAGVGILAALAVFALSRSLTSIASKDVLGRTVPKGLRGQIKGVTTVASAAVALTLGLALRIWGGDSVNTVVLAVLLAAAAIAWGAAAFVFATIREPAEEPEPEAEDGPNWAVQARDLWREDSVFRRFVTARALLLVSALSPPFVVTFGTAQGEGSLSSLGLFVIAQGIAGLIGGRIFGRLADRSSRRLMIGASIAASAVILAFLALARVPSLAETAWLATGTYLLLALAHVGARLARKTYVVDIAEGDQRTQYVAVANTMMGVLLLAVGAVTAALALLGSGFALLLLALLGIAGAWVGRGLPEAERA